MVYTAHHSMTLHWGKSVRLDNYLISWIEWCPSPKRYNPSTSTEPVTVTLLVKRISEDIIRLRGSHPGLPGWSLNPMVIILRRDVLRKDKWAEQEETMWGQRQRLEGCSPTPDTQRRRWCGRDGRDASQAKRHLELLEHGRQTQGPRAEPGPTPCFIQPGTLLLPGGSTELLAPS